MTVAQTKIENVNKLTVEEIVLINRGLNDLANNRIVLHEEVEKKYKKWL